MNPRRLSLALAAVAALGLGLAAYLGVWKWMICRVEVPAGSSLRLRYRGAWPFYSGTPAPAGTLVAVDDRGRPKGIGILEAMPGPGRHFYSPLEYEYAIVPDVIIEPGEIGLVTSKVGKPLPAGVILADGPGYRGTWRRVLTPGRYRMNDYAYDVKTVELAADARSGGPVGTAVGVKRLPGDPTLIPPGYVGVVTNKANDPRTGERQGIQQDVLQPGIYFLNPFEKQVDIISVGYNETTRLTRAETDADGSIRYQQAPTTATRPDDAFVIERDPVFVAGEGIEFPSSDGFTIHLDFTAIWGILPDQAPDVVRRFGALTDVEQKVIQPQIGSICRLFGSKRGAVDLLVGDKREAFQTDTAEELERVLESKNLTLLFGLTRHIYVPAQVREPIQRKFIADELKRTRDQEQLTAKAKADLTEAQAKVVLEERRTRAETGKLVAETTAQGEKRAREIEAETGKLVAAIEAQTAALQAQVTTTLGEAGATRIELANEAEADRYRQYVATLGGPEAYNRYVFAEGIPENLKLDVIHAGQGTFWTDLKGFDQTMLGKIASEREAASVPSPAQSRTASSGDR